MSFVLPYLVPGAAAWYTLKQVSKRTWRTVLRSALDTCCESFEWDDEHIESTGTARVRNLVLRASFLDGIFRNVGLCTSGSCTIASLNITVQIRLSRDLGIFSEPWTVDFDGVDLQLQPIANRQAVEALAAATPAPAPEADSAAEEPSPGGGKSRIAAASKAATDQLPIHRAVENLRLGVTDARIRIQANTTHTSPQHRARAAVPLASFSLSEQSSAHSAHPWCVPCHPQTDGGAAAFMVSWEALRLVTTEADWTPNEGMAPVEAGSILHKLLTIRSLRAVAQRHETELRSAQPLPSQPPPEPGDEGKNEGKEVEAEGGGNAVRAPHTPHRPPRAPPPPPLVQALVDEEAAAEAKEEAKAAALAEAVPCRTVVLFESVQCECRITKQVRRRR